MPTHIRKTPKITFNVNDTQRQHTGCKRRYDNAGLARLINSPIIQEQVAKGDMVGFYGHWIRQKYGMKPKEGAVNDKGQVITFPPALRTVYLSADDKGNITHQEEFFDTQAGRDAYDLYQNQAGGFSGAMTTVPKGFTEIPVRFYGFDYVLEPNFSGNRGYTTRFDSVDGNPMILDRFDSIDDEGLSEALPLIHCFDSAEEEILYQHHVMGDLYRKLQGQYHHVLDSVGEMQGQIDALTRDCNEYLAIIQRDAVNSRKGKKSSPIIFLDEQKLARFDSASHFSDQPLSQFEKLNTDDEAFKKEEQQIAKARRHYGVG